MDDENKLTAFRDFFSEGNLINVIVRIAPYGASFIPANFTYKNSQTYLGANLYEAWVYAGVVELLGISTVHMTMKLVEEARQNNRVAREKGREETADYKQAALTGVMAVFYLTVVILVNVLLDLGHVDLAHDWQIIAARALLSTITVPAAITLSMYNLYALRTGADQTKHRIASLQGQLGALQRKYNQVANRLELLRADYDALQDRSSEMAGLLQERDDRVAELDRIVAKLEKENGKLQRVIERPFEALPVWGKLNPTAQASLRYIAGEYPSMQAAAEEATVNKSTIQRVVRSLNGVLK